MVCLSTCRDVLDKGRPIRNRNRSRTALPQSEYEHDLHSEFPAGVNNDADATTGDDADDEEYTQGIRNKFRVCPNIITSVCAKPPVSVRSMLAHWRIALVSFSAHHHQGPGISEAISKIRMGVLRTIFADPGQAAQAQGPCQQAECATD